MKLSKSSQYWLEIMFILIVGLAPLLWFKPGYLAAGHDMSYPLAPIDFWLDRLYVWTDRIGSFGSNQTDAIPGVFIHGLQAFFYALTGSLHLAQKFDFIFWFALPGTTMYLLLKSLHPERENFVLRISGSLFYMLNHYLLQAWIIAEMSKFSIVSALPLVILAIINVNLKRRSIFKNALLISITLFFLNGGAGIPLWGGLLIAALTTLVITFLISPQPFYERLCRILIFSFSACLFVIVLNLYWMYPYLVSYQSNYTQRIGAAGGSEGAITWSQEISKNASFTNLFKLQGIPDWYDNPNHPYANIILNNYFFFFLTLTFSTIVFVSLFNKKGQSQTEIAYKVVFLAVLLVAIPFTAGSHLPTGIFYNLALKYIPGFAIFRTPFYKFGMALWFAFAYLFAVGLEQIAGFIKRPFWILGISVVLLGVYHYPVFSGKFFDWSGKYSTRLIVPDYIHGVKKELDNNKFSTRTLMLPQLNDGNKYIAYDWKYFSLSSIPSMLSRRPVLLNDIALSGNESGLINAIYQQLEKSNYSSLLKFTGADRVVVQEDFQVDEGLSYLINPTKKAAAQTPSFRFQKVVGKWKFFDVHDLETKPLFYIPQNLSYILTETSLLSQVSQGPEFPPLVDALVFKQISQGSVLNPVIDREKIQSITIQASCLNCDGKKQVEVARSNPPLIYPSNPFYFVIEFIDRQRSKKYKLPTDRIDFILGTMSKEVSAMDTIIVNPKNDDPVEYLLRKWRINVDLIAQLFQSISHGDQKEEYARRIYFYYWSLLTSAQKWREFELTELTKNRVEGFENLLSQSVQALSLMPKNSATASNYDVRSKLYSVNAPYSGTYKLGVYNYKADDQSTLSGFINDTRYNFAKVLPESKWYFGSSLRLEEGVQTIVLPDRIRREKSYPGFKFNTQPGFSKCEPIDIGKVDNEIDYELNLEYLTLSDHQVKIELLETNTFYPQGREKNIYPQRNASDPFSYKVIIKYKPSVYAETALLRVCTERDYDFSTVFELKGLKVVENYPDYLVFIIKENSPIEPQNYNLRFVALNQTAYLVGISNINKPFVLAFNSRFDPQWKIREIDPSQTNSYFKGDVKKYLNGKVTEYERQDNHMLTDLVFSKSAVKGPDLELNTYGNGWLIKNEEGKEKTFLIEYQTQKILYRTVLISATSLLGLIVTYYVLFRKNEKQNL